MDAKKSETDLYDPDFVLYFGSFGTAITSLPIQAAPYFYPIVTIALLMTLLFIVPLGLLVLV
jgi:hypothetical protein